MFFMGRNLNFLMSLILIIIFLIPMVFIGLIIAVSSASQDITIDALRIEQIKKDESSAMAAGAAIAVVGWWSGYKLGGLITLISADWFQSLGFDNYWQVTFILICGIIILFNLGLLFIPEYGTNERIRAQKEDQNHLRKNIKISGYICLLYTSDAADE